MQISPDIAYYGRSLSDLEKERSALKEAFGILKETKGILESTFADMERTIAKLNREIMLREMFAYAQIKPVPNHFEIGESYSITFVGGIPTQATAKITGRTTYFIKASINGGQERRYRVYSRTQGEEYFFPEGRYSAAPEVHASLPAA